MATDLCVRLRSMGTTLGQQAAAEIDGLRRAGEEALERLEQDNANIVQHVYDLCQAHARVTDLEARLSVAHQRIEDLELSLAKAKIDAIVEADAEVGQ